MEDGNHTGQCSGGYKETTPNATAFNKLAFHSKVNYRHGGDTTVTTMVGQCGEDVRVSASVCLSLKIGHQSMIYL